MKNPAVTSVLRTLSAFLAVLLALPVTWKGLTGFYAWLSPLIMLHAAFALRSFLWMNAFAFLVLLAVFLRKRWFCRNLCPVGWGCDLVSSLNKHPGNTYEKVPDIGKWLAMFSLAAALAGLPLLFILDPMSLFHGFFTLFSGSMTWVAIAWSIGLPLLLVIHLFYPRIWCSKLCPLGGFQLAMADLRSLAGRITGMDNTENPKPDQGRRYFLVSGMGLLAGLAIPPFLKLPAGSWIRPPGSLRPEQFNYLCCRCGNCTRACPTGIIKPHMAPGYALTWMTPEVSYSSGYCLESCNLCGSVCPTGAIALFSAGAKKQLFMGTAEIKVKDCFLMNNKECVRCREACKYEALALVSGINPLQVKPVVDTGKCVGCGACEVICPAACIRVIPVPG